MLAYEVFLIGADPTQELREGREGFAYYLRSKVWITAADAQRAWAEFNLIGADEARRRLNEAIRKAR